MSLAKSGDRFEKAVAGKAKLYFKYPGYRKLGALPRDLSENRNYTVVDEISTLRQKKTAYKRLGSHQETVIRRTVS
jgi:hypothetical protein